MCMLGDVKKVVVVPKEKAFTAYRAWDSGLQSLYQARHQTKWRMGEIVKSHAKPTKGNSCGLYCFKSARLMSSDFRDVPLEMRGIIKIWGTVVVHERGYRASNAEIVRITKGKGFLPSSPAEVAVITSTGSKLVTV